MTSAEIGDSLPSCPVHAVGDGAKRGRGSAYRRLRRDPLGLFVELKHTQGDVARARLGRRDFFLVSHPDDIQRVLVSNVRDYDPDDFAYKSWRRSPRPPARGFLRVESLDDHLRARRLLQPPFRKARLDAYWPSLVAATNRTLEMKTLTVALFAETVFGEALDPEREGLLDHIARCLEVDEFASSPSRELVNRLRIPRLIRLSASLEALLEVIGRLIEARRAEGGGGGDAISTLLRGAAEQGLEDREVALAAAGLLFAAADTTATAISWSLYLLLRDQAALERVRAEAEAATGPGELPFTRAVTTEAIRLYPPSWRIVNSARVDHILRGRSIAAGSNVWVSPYVVQRDPRWYDEPDEFRPERWLDGSSASRPKLSFVAFGAGPHKCIGEELAWRELAAIVPAVVRRFDLRLASTDEIRPRAALTLEPAGGVPVEVAER